MRNRFFVAIFLILLPLLAVGQRERRPGSLHTTLLDGVLVEYSVPQELTPILAADGRTVLNGVPAAVYIGSPVPPAVPVRIPPPDSAIGGDPANAASTYSITYIPNGGADLWGQPCVEFPAEAQAAFNAAAAIWGSLLKSPVPITIKAGWADLGGSTLGYSGGGTLYRDFSGAPKAGTWYGSALANSFYGSDIDSAKFDMHITYNKNFTWYYGTDGNTPSGKYDFMSVVLHEIAHGLNFAGSMNKSGSNGTWGYGTGYPNVYDTFLRDGGGTALTNTATYPNPSTSLGSALTSNSVWSHGPSAMAANGGQRVKIYAPSTWASGSSLSHLDYSTFAGTVNRLMVYAMSSATSIHDPGPVTKGLLTDFGWASADSSSARKADFNGDGKEDILWHHNAYGDNAVWFMGTSGSGVTFADQTDSGFLDKESGLARAGRFPIMMERGNPFDLNTGNVPLNLEGILEFASGKRDYGTPPIVFAPAAKSYITMAPRRETAVQSSMVRIGYAYLNSISDLNWKIVGTGDFDGNGKVDILWHNNATGDNAVWFMDGVSFLGYKYLNSTSDLHWKIVGTGDFDGDTKVDILWHNDATLDNAVWFMNGVIFKGYAYLNTCPDMNWKIVGTGDFDGNGKVDILWHNDATSSNAVWFMNGVTFLGYTLLNSVPDLNWKIGGAGDFNGDGKIDILWRHETTGANAVWFMNGTTFLGYEYLTNLADLNWEIVNR